MQMRPRREYSVAVVIGLVAMGLAMFGAGAALFLVPQSGYAPPPTPSPTVAASAKPSEPAPSLVESPSAEPSETPIPSTEPTASPTLEPTAAPTATPGDQFSARRYALPPCDDTPDCGVHIAQEGDWLSRLAVYYGISLDTITDANPEIDDPNRIRVGQVIRISR